MSERLLEVALPLREDGAVHASDDDVLAAVDARLVRVVVAVEPGVVVPQLEHERVGIHVPSGVDLLGRAGWEPDVGRRDPGKYIDRHIVEIPRMIRTGVSRNCGDNLQISG